MELVFLFIFTIFAIRNWRYSVIVWLPLHLMFDVVYINYAPPALSMNTAVSLMLTLVYFVKRKEIDRESDHKKFVFRKVFILYLFSYLVSLVFSILPLGAGVTSTIKFFVENFLLLYLFQKALKDRQGISLFVKMYCIVFVPIMALAIVEITTMINPYQEYLYYKFGNMDLMEGKTYYVPMILRTTTDTFVRNGFVRAFSFFHIPIFFGCASVLVWFYLCYIKKNHILKANNLISIGIICSFVCCFLSNSKTPMVGVLFFFLANYGLNKLLNPTNIVIYSFLIVLVLVYYPEVLNNMFALFDQNVAEDSGGSNAKDRLIQFNTAFNLFIESPIWGNGVDSLGKLVMIGNNSDIAGAESSWMKLLIERGIIGTIAYVYMYLEMFRLLIKSISCKTALFFLGGLLAMETATGFMDMTIFGAICIALFKYRANELPVLSVVK